MLLQTQRPEIGIMQALESLNDTQVNEFLCGKAPLNLSMRLGDHMMLIQLQLSTVSGTKPPVVSGPPPTTSPPSLLQASRNLQHTLRRLSADVFSGRDKGKWRVQNKMLPDWKSIFDVLFAFILSGLICIVLIRKKLWQWVMMTQLCSC